MNSVNLVGRVISSKFGSTKTGDPMCKLFLEVVRPSSPQAKDIFTVYAFGKIAEDCNSFVEAESRIGVSGEVRCNKQGDNVYYGIVMSSLTVINPPERDSGPEFTTHSEAML